jgi:hypothetical protein
MPLIVLSREEKAAAMAAASSDLRFHFAELNIPEDVQAAIFHKGFVSLRLYSGLDETRVEVRAALQAEIGIVHTESNENRRTVALLLSAWEASRTQVEAEDKYRVECRVGLATKPVQVTELAAMKKVVEGHLGKLRDCEVPNKAFLATKLEQVEQNDPRLEDLRDVLCEEDQDIDLFAGVIEQGSGVLKIKTGKPQISIPKNPEELRLRHRIIAITWEMLSTKHRSRTWLPSRLVDECRKLSDYILSKHVAGQQIMTNHGVRTPAWQLVLAYDAEIRKRAYELVRDGTKADLCEALSCARASAETMNLYFLVPLTLQSANTSNLSTTAASHLGGGGDSSAAPSKGQGKGAKSLGKQGKVVKNTKAKSKTEDGKRICYKFNNAAGCKGECGYAHVCQKCFGPHPKKQCPQRGPADTAQGH